MYPLTTADITILEELGKDLVKTLQKNIQVLIKETRQEKNEDTWELKVFYTNNQHLYVKIIIYLMKIAPILSSKSRRVIDYILDKSGECFLTKLKTKS